MHGDLTKFHNTSKYPLHKATKYTSHSPMRMNLIRWKRMKVDSFIEFYFKTSIIFNIKIIHPDVASTFLCLMQNVWSAPTRTMSPTKLKAFCCQFFLICLLFYDNICCECLPFSLPHVNAFFDCFRIYFVAFFFSSSLLSLSFSALLCSTSTFCSLFFFCHRNVDDNMRIKLLIIIFKMEIEKCHIR